MNRALAEAAAARVDEVLPVQDVMHELLGFPATVEGALLEDRRKAEARRGGRPPGARNKRLDEIARLVRERFGDVLLQQVAVATMPLADLIALGLKPGEAMAEKRLSAGTVLPYLEQRKPQQVDVTGRSVVYLDIQIGAGEGEQNPGVIDGLVLQLDSAQLDDAANTLTTQAVPPAAQLIADQAGAAPGQADGQARARTPGGAVFGARRPLHAPGAVVSPSARISDPTRNQGSAASGVGE